jgi:hypothetical protein
VPDAVRIATIRIASASRRHTPSLRSASRIIRPRLEKILVERFFAGITRKRIRRGIFKIVRM